MVGLEGVKMAWCIRLFGGTYWLGSLGGSVGLLLSVFWVGCDRWIAGHDHWLFG